MSIKQKLQNPFALVAQGFVVGAILFWATASRDAEAQPHAAAAPIAASATAEG